MFRDLVEAIRFESSQRGGSMEKVPGQGSHSIGRERMPSVKKAEVKAMKAKSRRMGKVAAAQADDTGTPGKRSRKKVPKHPPKRYWWGIGGTGYAPGVTRRQRGHHK